MAGNTQGYAQRPRGEETVVEPKAKPPAVKPVKLTDPEVRRLGAKYAAIYSGFEAAVRSTNVWDEQRAEEVSRMNVRLGALIKDRKYAIILNEVGFTTIEYDEGGKFVSISMARFNSDMKDLIHLRAIAEYVKQRQLAVSPETPPETITETQFKALGQLAICAREVEVSGEARINAEKERQRVMRLDPKLKRYAKSADRHIKEVEKTIAGVRAERQQYIAMAARHSDYIQRNLQRIQNYVFLVEKDKQEQRQRELEQSFNVYFDSLSKRAETSKRLRDALRMAHAQLDVNKIGEITAQIIREQDPGYMREVNSARIAYIFALQPRLTAGEATV
jgi:uncharacterized Zn finger protein (UPF0148 family)